MESKDAPDPEGEDRGAAQPARRDGRSQGRSADDRNPRSGPRPIGEVAGRLMAKPLGKRGFAAVALAAEWATIVGPTLGAATMPLRVAFPAGARSQGTLHLRVASGAFALQLQHLEPLIVERVNGHFGYAAVARLTLSQGPVVARTRPRRPAPAAPAAVDPVLATMIAAVEDPALREALKGLGRQLAGGWQRP